jgi:hypothetical protein
MTTVQLPSPRAERRPALASFTGLLAAVAFLTPAWAAEPDRASGFLLLAGVVAELVYSFRSRTAAAQQSAWWSAGVTLLLALVLLNTAWLAVTALGIFLAGPFALDSIRRGWKPRRSGRPDPRRKICVELDRRRGGRGQAAHGHSQPRHQAVVL